MIPTTKLPCQFISLSSFQKLGFWDYYTLSSKASIFSNFPLVELGTVLKQRKESIVIDDAKIYKRCRVQLYGNGVVLRDTNGIEGKEIKTKKQQVCNTNDFLVAEIDAKFGGYGIVPTELNGAIVSSHYFLFEIDTTQLLPEFLEIVVKCNDFSKQVKATGSTNYAAIRPYHVLAYLIPLPSLVEQDRIVQVYNNRINEAKKLEDEAKSLENGIKKYLLTELGINENVIVKGKDIFRTICFKDLNRWDFKESLLIKSKYPVKKIGQVLAFISTGTTPPTNRKEYFENGEINFYTPSDIGEEMILFESERKLSQLAIEEKKARKFNKRTLLFVGIGSTVGKVGIVGNDFATSNQQITGLVFNEVEILPEFAFHYFSNFKHITIGEKTQATIPIINQDKIKNIPIPVPPIKIQQDIDSNIKTLKENIRKKRNNAEFDRQLAITEFECKIFMPCN